jgi:hypothetical protein
MREPVVVQLPVRAERVPNNPIHEFLFVCCDGQPAARQKRIVLMAREVGLIGMQDADVLIDALNLRAA